MGEKNLFNKLVKARYGYCLVNENDQYIGQSIIQYGEFSELEANLFKQICNSGDVVIEVGANIGTHTQVLSNLVGSKGKVFAFEPQRIVYQTLCANVALNSMKNVYTYEMALGKSPETIFIPPIDYENKGNFGGMSIYGFTEGEAVKKEKLDSFLSEIDSVKLIKIDVEGMEGEVLYGASKLIEKFQPLLYVENDRQEKSKELIELIDSFGYDLYWHLPKLFNKDNFFKNTANIFSNIVSVNMLCVPKNSTLQIKQMKKVTSSSEHPMKNQTKKSINFIMDQANYAYKNKEYKKAIKLYFDVLKQIPNDANLHNQIGMVFESLGDMTKAIDAYKNAIKIDPNFSKAINNLGVVLYKQKRYNESAEVFQIALNVDPKYHEVYSNMGAALNKALQYDEAIKALKTAIQKMPKHGGAYTNLGNVYNKIHNYKQAASYHEKSIELEPNGCNAYSNVGTSYKNQGFTNKAIESYKKAIKLKPDFENAHFDLATVYLSKGDFINGLKEYEWRFKKEEMQSHIFKHKHIFSKPMMKKGEDIKGKNVLVHSEQGFGDSIMYARFLPQLKALGCTLAVECRDELKTLFEAMSCTDMVVGRDENRTPEFDLHLPIMSLAYILDVKSFEDFPTEPYFEVKKDDKFTLESKKIKIGLCWSASATGESYEGKVFDLKNFEPLIKNTKIQIYSLQVGHGSEQIEENGYEKDIIDVTAKLKDFSKTASFMKELDLVISSDTSVAHLAGAIGVKTYTLLQKYPDWRWLNKGDESYLYPSMKLFRQKQNRNWKSVFQSLFGKMNKEYKLKLKV
jgi:FkbM family methyltransferase